MATPRLVNRASMTTTTTGTGSLTLGSADAQHKTFANAGINDGNTVPYVLLDGNGVDWEEGLGTYTASGTVLARTVILASSNSGAAISLSSNTHTVFIAGLREVLPIENDGIVSGRYYYGINPMLSYSGGFAASLGLSSGLVQFTKIRIREYMTIDKIGIKVTSAAAFGKKLEFCMFRISGGKPSDILWDTHTTSLLCDSTGDKEVTVTQKMIPGVYFAGVATDGSPQVNGFVDASDTAQGVTTTSEYSGFWYDTHTIGAAFTSNPTPSWYGPSGYQPAIYLKAA